MVDTQRRLAVPERFRSRGRFRSAGQTIYFELVDPRPPLHSDVVLRFFTTEEEAAWIAQSLNACAGAWPER